MVHRAPDSRLLTNLIHHEKEYTKHLAALFPLSHAALASLSAYAAASPAQSIATLVDILAGADDALQRYTHAVDAWREQLVALKNLEDDLAAVLRDRDILCVSPLSLLALAHRLRSVTRLIKASKSTRDAHRSSRLVAPLTGLASASLSSLPSTNSTIAGSTGPASTNARLAQAQAELQACEAHLVTKERELDARRISIARDGLGARCRALIDCGWVWGEMGKQGLKALGANGSSLAGTWRRCVSCATLTPMIVPSAIPPRLGTNPTTYASDNSSLTPSQSASQTAAQSVEHSHEGPPSKEHDETKPKPPARKTRPKDDEDLTLTLPPAHAMPELAFPTGVRAQPLQNGDPTSQTPDTSAHTTPAPRRKRTNRARRPPSQHIAEVSDEGSDADHNANVSANPLTSHTPFPTARAAHDTSSEDEQSVRPLQVVDNDPFEVIRRSMLGPSVPTAPSPFASTPDVRVSGTGETSPSKAGVGQTPGSSPTKRQRRTSMAFFGSLRGLFRKPKERERLGADWDDGHSSPSPTSPNQTKTKAGGGGWVTRTDARIKSRGGEADSDDEPTPTGTTTNVARRGTSGTRLRKGRPGASMRENGSPYRDGWITDSPVATGSGVGAGGGGTGRSRTRRGTVKRKKTSVADLRGIDQGHTDGEVDGGGRRVLERGSTNGNGNAPESSRPKLDVKVEEVARREAAPTDTYPTADPNANGAPGTQHRRATTTTATSRKPSTNAAPGHRRSASLSLVDTHVTSASASSQATSSGGSMSRRKPPPQIEPPTQSQPQTQARTQESQSKQNARRHLGNGHAAHVHKGAQSLSLMSIVADVTRQNQGQSEGGDKARSMDIPRAPGGVNGRGHARAMSEDGGQVGQGQRAIKLPLRSALRNASRTPSPSPAPVTVPAVVPVEDVDKDGVEEERGRGVIPPSLRDSASISSYETGRESFYVEEPSPIQTRSSPPRSQSQPPVPRSHSPVLGSRADTPSPPSLSFTFPPPPADPPPVRGGTTTLKPIPNANAIQPHPSSSTVSTETTLPARRKSVRVSLQPTFSSTPPALGDEDGEGYAPWNESFSEGGRRARGGDVWADSSEEDEVYSRARRLLSLVGHDKGKTRAKK